MFLNAIGWLENGLRKKGTNVQRLALIWRYRVIEHPVLELRSVGTAGASENAALNFSSWAPKISGHLKIWA